MRYSQEVNRREKVRTGNFHRLLRVQSERQGFVKQLTGRESTTQWLRFQYKELNIRRVFFLGFFILAQAPSILVAQR